jgi:hypothetical protein
VCQAQHQQHQHQLKRAAEAAAVQARLAAKKPKIQERQQQLETVLAERSAEQRKGSCALQRQSWKRCAHAIIIRNYAVNV